MQPFLISVTLHESKKCKRVLLHKLDGTEKDFKANRREELYQ